MRRLVVWGNRAGGWRVLAAIYLAAVVVRGATAVFIRQPGFTDSYYYYHIAANLYAGRGFVEDFIWNYLEIPSTVSHASNTYWGPLASVLLLPSFWVFGPSFRAAQVPMVLLSALLPVITYVTARDLLGSHRQALVAAVLTVFSGVYLAYWTVPEGYVPFALAGALALLAISRSTTGHWRWSALAGACVALAQLARSDGILLLGVGIVVWAYSTWHRPPGVPLATRLAHPLAACLAYALVIAPWLYRNWIAFGVPLVNPGLKTVLLREYNDVFTYGGQLDLDYFLGAGIGTVVIAKLLAVLRNVHILAQILSYYLIPLAAVGLWALRRQHRAACYFIYAITLYATMTLAFTFPGQFGSLLHSAAALLPFLTAATARGLDVAIDALLRRRPHLAPATARAVFSYTLVLAQIVFTIGLTAIAVRDWGSRYSYALYPQAIALLSPQLAPDEPVMILDPPAYAYFSGRPAIAVPNNNPETLVAVARRYGARFVVLEKTHARPVNRLYQGEESHPGLVLRFELTNDRGQELKIYELG